MGKNLIIRQGARTTRLGVREGAVLIGRDADCDLSLEDQTISRHHARLDVATNGVKLVDLNSSNGCWVNDERVSERVLEPGDVIRLGTIRMTIEDSPAGRPKASEPVQDEDAWLFFSVSPGPSMGSGVVSGTEDTLPFLPASSLGLQPDALPPLQPPQAVSHRAPDPPARVPEKRLNWLDEAARRTAAWSWSTKIGLTLTLLGLLAYAGVAWPLVKALRRSSTEDFLRRGHALARYLAAENEHLLAEGRLQELSVEGLSREPGVKEALILGLDGKVLAPSGYSHESIETIEGIEKKTADIYTFYLGRSVGGDYHFVLPLTDKGRRIGLALVTVSMSDPIQRSAVLTVLIVSLVLVAAGTFAAIKYATTMTLKPLGALVEDVEAVVKGDEPMVPSAHGYREVEELAASINRVIERAAPVPAGAPRIQSVVVKAVPGADVMPSEDPPVPRVPPVNVPQPQGSEAPETPEEPEEEALPSPAIVTPWSAPVETPVAVPQVAYERSSAAAALAVPEPRLAARPAPGEAARNRAAGEGELTVDENYIVTSADPAVLAVLGARASQVQGKHLLEAISELSLLELVLDLLNALSEGGPTFRHVDASPTGPLDLSVRRRGLETIVRLTPAKDEEVRRRGI